MPTNGWAAPQTRFWMAIASAKTSRPQPFSVVMGVRKKPMVDRGPKLMTATRQPATTITGTDRQDGRSVGCVLVVIDAIARLGYCRPCVCSTLAPLPLVIKLADPSHAPVSWVAGLEICSARAYILS